MTRTSLFAFVPVDTRLSQAQGALCPVYVFMCFPSTISASLSSPRDSCHIPHQLCLVTYGVESIPSRDNVSVLLEDSRLPGTSMDRLLQCVGSSTFLLSHTTFKVFQCRKSYAQSPTFRREELGASGTAELKKCFGQQCNCHHNKYPP